MQWCLTLRSGGGPLEARRASRIWRRGHSSGRPPVLVCQAGGGRSGPIRAHSASVRGMYAFVFQGTVTVAAIRLWLRVP